MSNRNRFILRRREFPLTPDGTTAGDRAGWVVEYLVDQIDGARSRLKECVIVRKLKDPGQGSQLRKGDRTFVSGHEITKVAG